MYLSQGPSEECLSIAASLATINKISKQKVVESIWSQEIFDQKHEEIVTVAVLDFCVGEGWRHGLL